MIRNTLIWLFLMTSYALAIAYPQNGVTHVASFAMVLWTLFGTIAVIMLMVHAHRIAHGADDVKQKSVTEATQMLTIIDGYSTLRKRFALIKSITLMLIVTYKGDLELATAYLLALLLTYMAISAVRHNLDRYTTPTPAPAPAPAQ